MKRIKIVSDGNPFTTKVFDVDSGEEIGGITSIDWHIEVEELATATITFANVAVEVVADRNDDVKSNKDMDISFPANDNDKESTVVVKLMCVTDAVRAEIRNILQSIPVTETKDI